MKTKICSKCKEEKNLSEFHKDKSKKDGLYIYCKNCRNENYQLNKEKIKKQRHLNYLKNKEKILKRAKKYYLKNKKRIIKRSKLYEKNNRKKITKRKLIYEKRKREDNIRFKIRCILKTRIYQVLKGNNKSLSTMFLIGCEIDYLMYHIQNQFTEGMNWDNYGAWHIDHKLPCASFDLSKPNEQSKCFHYTNLQPLWAKDNLKKGKHE